MVCFVHKQVSFHRFWWIPLLVWGLIVLGLATAVARDPVPPANEAAPVDAEEVNSSESPAADGANARLRAREGSKISDELGEFQRSGDRYSFFPKDGRPQIRVLENLTLERVARVLDDDPPSRLWSVSGTITEFRGENFLLLTRAALKARSATTSRPFDRTKKADENASAGRASTTGASS